MIHIFQQLKVVSENFCLFWDLVQIYLESQDIKADSFLLSQFPPNPSDSFHFSILPNHKLFFDVSLFSFSDIISIKPFCGLTIASISALVFEILHPAAAQSYAD